MRAMVLEAPRRPLRDMEISTPSPDATQVLLQARRCKRLRSRTQTGHCIASAKAPCKARRYWFQAWITMPGLDKAANRNSVGGDEKDYVRPRLPCLPGRDCR